MLCIYHYHCTPYLLRQGLFLNPVFIDLIRLSGQQAHGICLSQSLSIYMGTMNPYSSPLGFAVVTLPTDLSPFPHLSLYFILLFPTYIHKLTMIHNANRKPRYYDHLLDKQDISGGRDLKQSQNGNFIPVTHYPVFSFIFTFKFCVWGTESQVFLLIHISYHLHKAVLFLEFTQII